jgi:hypothetical protein
METLAFRQEGYFGVIEYTSSWGFQREMVSKFTSQKPYGTLKACAEATQRRVTFLEKQNNSVSKAIVVKASTVIQWDPSTEILIPQDLKLP